MNSPEDWISRIGNAHKTILIFLGSILPLFVLLEFVERNHAGTETQADELVAATYGKHRNSCAANKLRKTFKDGRIVVIKISKRAANYNGIRLELSRCCRYL